METTRRGFFGVVAGALAASRVPLPAADAALGISERFSATYTPIEYGMSWTVPESELGRMLGDAMREHHEQLAASLFSDNAAMRGL
jgi:hypothetical protein